MTKYRIFTFFLALVLGSICFFNSSNLALANNAPTTTGTIASDYGANKTSENLALTSTGEDVDFDFVIDTANWLVGGAPINVLILPFNTNTGTLVADAITDLSTLGNHGRLGGGVQDNAPTWTASGRSGGAYDFDGNDYILIDDDNSLDLTTSATFEAWIKPDTTVGARMIIGKSNSYLLWIANGTLLLEIYDGGSWYGVQTANVSTTEFTHVVATYDGQNLRLYKNGVLVKITNHTGSISVNGNDVGIGEVPGWNRYFDGIIDEVRIYDRVLSDEQIELNYLDIGGNNHLSKYETASGETWSVKVTPNDSQIYGNTVTTNQILLGANNAPTATGSLASENNTNKSSENLALTYSGSDVNHNFLSFMINWFESGSSITVLNMSFDKKVITETDNAIIDYSGYGNHGQLGGGTPNYVPAWTASGRRAADYTFDGINDFIEIDDSNSLDLTREATFEAWIKPTDISGDRMIIGKSNAYFFWITNGVIRVEVYSSGNWYGTISPVVISANEYAHVAGTFDGTVIKAYKNGELVSASNHVGGISTNANNVGIGNAPGWSRYFKGEIDEPRIYNRALSAEQIALHYHDGLPAYNQISKYETNSGDTWYAKITVTDVFDDSAAVQVNSIAVGENTAPTHDTPSLASQNGNNTSQEDLTVTAQNSQDSQNNAITNIFNWLLSGSNFAVLNMPFDKHPELLFDSYEDYQTTAQGNNNTYYYYYNGSYNEMVTDGNGWAAGYPTANYEYALIDRTSLHPGSATYQDVAYAWKSNYAGPVYIEAMIADGSNTWGDGVNIKVLHNDSQLLSQSYNNGFTEQVNVTQATVAENDKIYFRINRRSTNDYDSTNYRFRIYKAIKDYSGNNKHGGLGGFAANPNWNPNGKVGGAFEFDGSDDYIGLGDSFDDITAGADQKFTIESWIKPGSTMTNNQIITKLGDSNCSENQRQWAMTLSTGSKPYFVYYGSLGTANYREVLGTTPITNTNKWYHLVMIYDGSIDTLSLIHI